MCREERPGRRAPRDLAAEAHVRALACWQMIPGAFFVLVNLLLAAVLVVLAPPQVASATVLPLLLVALPLASLTFACGYCLWRYHNWARWLNVTLSGLGLLGGALSLLGELNAYALLGTLLNAAWQGAVIYVLVSKAHVFEPAYRDAALASRRPVRYWTSPFFWIPALAFVGLLIAGAFLISNLIVLLG
ncbi:MAG TPA: hypothetical protein DEA08_27110 [Planctomycetes bacterium]|nr:hypothetical protein [Planctomycetota bacterium]